MDELLHTAAVSAAGAAIFDWDLVRNTIKWSGALESLPIYPHVEKLESGQDFLDMLSINTRNRLFNLLEHPVTSITPLKVEIEMASALGSVWFSLSGQHLPGENGGQGHFTGLIYEITELRHQIKRLEYLALRDELTGLLNRNSLRAELSQTIDRAATENRFCAFLVCSIDWLGLINDTYGFDAADEVIVEIAQRLQHALRVGDIIGRMAGNKFGIILKNCGDFEVPVVADRLRSVVRSALIETHCGGVASTCSVGAVWLPQGAPNSQEAMLRAEEALERARTYGRDSYYMYRVSPQRNTARLRLMSVADEVISALKEKRLMFAYQPIFDAHSRQIVEYECLLRMKRPDNTIASAGEFVPAAEQLGLIRMIDWFALEMVIEQLEANSSIFLCVNVSGTTSGDAAWLQSFVNYVSLHSHIAKRLMVELTETAMLNEFEENARFVSQLQQLGCKVAIDDFGAGYTSFRNLQKMHVDLVKIDGSYINGLSHSPQNQIFVRTLVDLAKSFDLQITAEWVGSEEDAQLLKSFGVDRLQGFFLGEPKINPKWPR